MPVREQQHVPMLNDKHAMHTKGSTEYYYNLSSIMKYNANTGCSCLFNEYWKHNDADKSSTQGEHCRHNRNSNPSGSCLTEAEKIT